jgi:hypothetical protein
LMSGSVPRAQRFCDKDHKKQRGPVVSLATTLLFTFAIGYVLKKQETFPCDGFRLLQWSAELS